MLPQTETLRDEARGLDTRPGPEILALLLHGQQSALGAIQTCLPQIDAAAALVAQALQTGGDIHYAAAGSSALMGLADGVELPGTFGIAPERIHIHMAGGVPVTAAMPGHTEDDVHAAEKAARGIKNGDVVIALSASGTTPYPIAFTRIAAASGARIVAIANNAGTPLLAQADCAIHLPTPPEVIAGSTRLGAATAQKAVLNMISTLMAMRLGHVHDGMMVNLIADNEKLRQRALGIVERIVPGAAPRQALDLAGGHVKEAVLIAAGAVTREQASALLNRTGGHLRPALAELEKSTNQGRENT